ncbi:MAG: hypothetical protein IPL49_05605 [Saprospirales bacterium]|nr:hypothetical protein [Saprospirales bacterium]MBK8490383.1 hypothetical protein [Saprospirales bacterium]
MKNWMVFYLLLLGAGIFLLPACGDDEDNNPPCYCSDEGIILGEDPRDCFCCGGWFIAIEGDTLRALTLPQEFYTTLVPNEFPLPVYLEWTPDETPCLGDEIEVACIRRRE